jgi:hypothetical protein
MLMHRKLLVVVAGILAGFNSNASSARDSSIAVVANPA